MKKLATILLLSFACVAWAQSDTDNTSKSANTSELQSATETIQHMTAAADNGVPEAVLQDAKCVAVIPKLAKGAFVVGGEHGDGVATCRTSSGWSAPAPFSISGISFGPQIGGKATDLLMFIMNDEGMNQLLSGHFKVGGDVSAAAGPVGRTGSAEAGWKAAILTYSSSKGAFIGASINGAELNQDKNATRASLLGPGAGFTLLWNRNGEQTGSLRGTTTRNSIVLSYRHRKGASAKSFI